MNDRPTDTPGSGDLDTWIRTGDVDELLREVDRTCGRRDWPALLVVRDRCRRAVDSGHQLWPVSSFAEYRLALEAPADVAGPVVDEGGGYLGAGPLTEVVAQHHPWAELDAHLRDPVARRLVAQERAIRGERIARGDAAGDDLPDATEPWESPYAPAEYRADGARFPTPSLPTVLHRMDGVLRDEEADGRDGTEALLGSLRHWSARSSGAVRARCVAGGAADAVRSLVEGTPAAPGSGAVEPGAELLQVELTAGGASALLAWAAASGAARGPRRGAATGRFDAWWTLAVLAGVEDDWPHGVGGAAAELRWWRWGPPAGDVGWWCRLAVEDPDDGLSWAIEATDRR